MRAVRSPGTERRSITTPYLSGSDEYGAARHAHKRGLYTQGRSFRGNVEGSDPRCSFHWFGHSGRLYVFEAPIDLLAS